MKNEKQVIEYIKLRKSLVNSFCYSIALLGTALVLWILNVLLFLDNHTYQISVSIFGILACIYAIVICSKLLMQRFLEQNIIYKEKGE